MAKKGGGRTLFHQWIVRLAVILAVPIVSVSEAFGFAGDVYRLSIFLILAAIAGIGLLLLKRFGRVVYVALFGFVVFTYLFDVFQDQAFDLLRIGSDIISPYFLVPLLFGVYLFTSPVQRLLR